MRQDLRGKVALITGAGKGRGRAVALAFAARGAQVAVNDISPLNLEPLVSQGAGQIRAYVEDVSNKVGAQAVLKQAEDDLGRLDFLINHAAVEPRLPLLDMDEWDWQRVLDVNLTGAFLMMQSAGRMMRAQGSGTIVNLLAAPAPPARHAAAYLAGLHGLLALTRAAAAELAEYGIRVHAVGTGIAEFQQAEAQVPRQFEQAVLYLCTHASLNGQIVAVEV